MTVIPRDQMTRISTYAEAQEVLRSADFRNTLTTRRSKAITGSTVGGLVHDEHMERRRAEMEVFSRASLKDYEFADVVPAIAEALTGEADLLDLIDVMRGGLLRVSARVIGLDDVVSDSRTRQLRDIADRIGEAASVEWTTRDPEEVIAAALAAKAEFASGFYGPSLARRRKLVAQSEDDQADLPHDLITVLLKTYGEDWDDDLRLREALFYLAAASSTTSHASPHIFAEIAQWLSENPESADRAQDLGFIQRAVAEGLRLHPPVPGLLRGALEDITLSSGRRIVEGEQLLIDLNAVNRDPAVYGDDADAFDPDRVPSTRAHLYALSFAAGPHTCPGRLIAVGAGNGQVGAEDAPVGVLVRLMEQLLRHGVVPDPDRPAVLRTDTDAHRYASFPVVVANRSRVGA